MSELPASSAPPRVRRWIITAAAVAVIAAGAGAYVLRPKDPLAADPAGAKTCHNLAEWLQGKVEDPDTGRPVTAVLMRVSLAGQAAKSTTPAIKAAAGQDLMDSAAGRLLQGYGGPASLQFADLAKLHTACTDAGEKMPSYREPS